MLRKLLLTIPTPFSLHLWIVFVNRDKSALSILRISPRTCIQYANSTTQRVITNACTLHHTLQTQDEGKGHACKERFIVFGECIARSRSRSQGRIALSVPGNEKDSKHVAPPSTHDFSLSRWNVLPRKRVITQSRGSCEHPPWKVTGKGVWFSTGWASHASRQTKSNASNCLISPAYPYLSQPACRN